MSSASKPRTFSDFADGDVHIHHHKNLKLFQNSCDVALAMSTDGAQLTVKKQSDVWLVLFTILSLPGDIRYKAKNTIIVLSTSGANAPGEIETFIYPVFQEMIRASEGIWTWDAIDESYFFHHVHLCMVLGDMLGSAKVNGLVGHLGVHGD